VAKAEPSEDFWFKKKRKREKNLKNTGKMQAAVTAAGKEKVCDVSQ